MHERGKANRGPSAGPANRAALIAAAREVFGEAGFGAPLSAVAKRAGVGQGSLYRHFPTRPDLALAVFEENVAEVEALAARPETTLEEVADVITRQTEAAAAFVHFAASEDLHPGFEPIEARLLAVIESKWDDAVAAGSVGPGATPADFFRAISLVAGATANAPREQRREVAAAAWELIRRGLDN